VNTWGGGRANGQNGQIDRGYPLLEGQFKHLMASSDSS